MSTTHGFQRRCDDCGRRVASPVEFFRRDDLGVVVGDGETVCRDCLGKRIVLAERQVELFERAFVEEVFDA